MVVQWCPCSRAKTSAKQLYYTGERPHLLFVPAQGGLEIAGTDNDLLGVLPLVAGAARVASVLLQQLPLGRTEAVALPLSGRGMARHPPGDRTGILAGLVGRDDAVQLLQAPPQSGEVDQAMPRGMGGDQRAVQGATTGGGQALRLGPFRDVTMKVSSSGPNRSRKAYKRLREGAIPNPSH